MIIGLLCKERDRWAEKALSNISWYIEDYSILTSGHRAEARATVKLIQPDLNVTHLTAARNAAV